MKEQLIFQRLLKKKFDELRFENPKMSRRDFSKSLGLSAGAISEIFNGQRKVSLKLAKRIARKIDLDPQSRVELFGAFDKFGKKPRRDRSKELTPADPKFLRLSSDQFRVIEDWYHFAILALLDTSDFKSDIEWIAERLDISVTTTRTALDRLLRLGLIQINEMGSYSYSGQHYHTSDDVPDSSIRLAHMELLEKARIAINTLPVEDRDFTSLMLTLSPNQLPRAKEMIRKLRADLLAELATDPQPEVYQLGIQLFPLTRIRKTKKKDHNSNDESQKL